MWVVRVAGLGERGRGVEFTVWEIEPIKCFETIMRVVGAHDRATSSASTKNPAMAARRSRPLLPDFRGECHRRRIERTRYWKGPLTSTLELSLGRTKSHSLTVDPIVQST
jgi:hypothetical protein